MSLRNRIDNLEWLLFGPNGDEPAQAEYCSWPPSADPPIVPTGKYLAPATCRLRDELMAMDGTVPRGEPNA